MTVDDSLIYRRSGCRNFTRNIQDELTLAILDGNIASVGLEAPLLLFAPIPWLLTDGGPICLCAIQIIKHEAAFGIDDLIVARINKWNELPLLILIVRIGILSGRSPSYCRAIRDLQGESTHLVGNGVAVVGAKTSFSNTPLLIGPAVVGKLIDLHARIGRLIRYLKHETTQAILDEAVAILRRNKPPLLFKTTIPGVLTNRRTRSGRPRESIKHQPTREIDDLIVVICQRNKRPLLILRIGIGILIRYRSRNGGRGRRNLQRKIAIAIDNRECNGT